MKKIWTRILCAMTPSRSKRHRLRALYKTTITGNNNTLILVHDGKEYVSRDWDVIPNMRFDIRGNNNIVKINRNLRCTQACSIKIDTDNANFVIMAHRLEHTHIWGHIPGNGQSVFIGSGTFIRGASIFLTGKTACHIGNNCLFSTDIDIKTTDSHTIRDRDNGQVINNQKHTLTIGDNCWIGQYVHITKNAKIPNNTIVGVASVVAKSFDEEYTCIAGNPAKVVKQNVTWELDDPYNSAQLQTA